MDQLKQVFGYKLQENVSLKGITTVGIGGPARWFLTIKTLVELKQAISICKQNQIKFFLMGSGSNLLISDSGLDRLVIKAEVTGITQDPDGLTILAGTPLQYLVNFTIDHNLSGAQKLNGIPGTVGGAIFGNAGAYGQTISDYLTQVLAFDGQNEVILSKPECQFSYRDSGFKRNNLIILSAKFNFPIGEKTNLKQEADQVLVQRLQKYHPSLKCPGSFFKNLILENLSPEVLNKLPPQKDTYGKIASGAILEEVGAKGDRLGNIQIAPYHGNLFINLGNGTAQDFWSLAKKYHDKVLEKYGVALEPEVQLINLPPLNS